MSYEARFNESLSRLLEHYGPGAHDSGSSQDVHGGGGTGGRADWEPPSPGHRIKTSEVRAGDYVETEKKRGRVKSAGKVLMRVTTKDGDEFVMRRSVILAVRSGYSEHGYNDYGQDAPGAKNYGGGSGQTKPGGRYSGESSGWNMPDPMETIMPDPKLPGGVTVKKGGRFSGGGGSKRY